MRAKITKRLVDSFEASDREQQVFDTELKGFCLRVLPSGVKRYDVRYRVHGRRRRYKVGDHGPLTAKSAREEAEKILGLVALGEDPADGRYQARTAGTVGELALRYLREKAAGPSIKASTRAGYTRYLHKHVIPHLGNHQVRAVTKGDIYAFHADMRDRPYEANHALAMVKIIFYYAEEIGLRPEMTNPARGVKKFPEQARERLLTAAEIGRLGDALRVAETVGVPDPTRREVKPESPSTVLAIRVLLLTGCRLSEILTLQWDHVDLEKKCLRLEDSKTGAKIVPLGAPALDLLANADRGESPWVIKGKRIGHHLVNLRKPWLRIRAAAGLEDVRIHDLRHAFASIAAAGGQGLPIIGGILGHRRAETTKRYAHLEISPLLAAADSVSKEIAAALEKGAGESAEVVGIKRGR